MYAMQYEIALPADYDMGIIRDRVKERSHLLDRFPGLGLKAYLIREKGQLGSHGNAYAPFYLWTDVRGMREFLVGGGGFAGVVDSFGRPLVQTWLGLAFVKGPSNLDAVVATKWETHLALHQDSGSVEGTSEEWLREVSKDSSLVGAACAIDPSTWSYVRIALWARRAVKPDATCYEILHLSQPEQHRLPSLDAPGEPGIG